VLNPGYRAPMQQSQYLRWGRLFSSVKFNKFTMHARKQSLVAGAEALHHAVAVVICGVGMFGKCALGIAGLRRGDLPEIFKVHA